MSLVLVTVLTLVLSTNSYLGSMALASPTSPLDVTDTDSPDPVLSGTELTYTWAITNTGGAKVTEVVGTTHVDLAGIGVPPQLVITSTVGTCAQLSSTVTCTAGTLQGGQSWFVTIRGLVNAAAGSTLNNTVTVTGTKSAQTFSTSASASTLVTGPGPGGPLPDLSVQKTGPASVAISAPFDYSLNVNNTGSANATNVRVVDTLPTGVVFASAGTTSLFVCTLDPPPSNTVTCDGGAVNAGANATITLSVVAPATTGQIANNAKVDPLDSIAEGNEFNNTSATIYTTITPPPPPPPFTITKVQTSPTYAGQPGVVTPGDIVTYTITATNISGYRADYDVLTDATQGLEASSLTATATATGNTTTTPVCTIAAPNATCSWTRWPAGATATMVVTGKVVAPAGMTIIDTATIQGNVRNTGYSVTTKLPSVVKPGIDLTITKSDSPDPLCASSWPAIPPMLCTGGLTYTFVVGNSGIFDATGVVVRDPLPLGTIFDSYTTTGGFVCAVDPQNVVTCTGGTIPHESTREITFVLVAPPTTGTITNTVTVDPNNNIFESDETNNVASQSTTITTGIDLTIDKVDSPPGFDPIATNGTQTYTITVENLGPQDATNIRVRDTLPAGTTFLSATADNGFTCSHANGTVECITGHILGSMAEFYDPPGPAVGAGDDDATIIIKIFAMGVVGTMHNEVRVDPLNEIAEINETNNFEFEDTVVQTGDDLIGAFNQLTIDKSQTSPANPVARNAVVTYDLHVKNLGTDPAFGIAVRDFLPAGARYIEATDTMPGPNAFNCIEVSNVVTCTGGTLSGTVTAVPGVPTTRHITVKMFAPDTPGTYINQAIVDPDNTIPEGNEFDNIDNQTTIVTNAGNGPFNELSIVKSATPAGLTQNGTTMVYSLAVTNTGSDPVFNVVVKDFLPAGTTFVSAWDDTPPAGPQAGDFLCMNAGGVVTCSGGTLDGMLDQLGAAYPTTRTIKIQVNAPNVAFLDAVNQAFVDPDNAIPEGDETNNTSSVTNMVRSFIDLTAKKTGGDSAAQSSTFEYELQAINTAAAGTPGATAFNVTLHDALPVGLIVLGAQVQDADNNDWGCQVLENPVNVVDCIGTLPSGATVKVKIAVFVTATSDVKLINEACVDWLNTTVESDETNNCAKTQTLVGAPDLAVTKTALHNPVSPGQDQVYTINVVNIGNVDATSVTITDTLPTGLTYVSAIGTNGFTCSEAAGTVTCTYTPVPPTVALAKQGGSTSITLTATVGASAVGPITNTATATSVPADGNSGNNSGSVTTSVGGAGIDLQLLSAVDTPDPVQEAGVLTYTLNVLNSGTADASGVVIKNSITAGATAGLNMVNAVASEGFSCVVTTGNPIDVTCTRAAGVLEAGHTVTVTITGIVTAAAGGSITNEVKVDPLNAITETVETNNDFTVVTSVVSPSCPPSPPSDPCIDLVMGQVLASDDPVDVGDTVSYTITVTNTGNVSTTTLGPGPNVYIEFDVPTQITYTAGTVTASSGFSCSDAFLPAIFCFGDLAASSGVVMSLSGTVNANDGNTITATATVDPFFLVPEFDEITNNSSSVSITRN